MNRPALPVHIAEQKSLRAWLTILLLFILLLPVAPLPLATTEASDSGDPPLPCPANLAGKFTVGPEPEYGFQWYNFFGAHTFADQDRLHLSFAIIPSGSGSTFVALDEADGRTGYGFSFTGGLINGTVPYAADEWNLIEIELRFDSKDYVLTVNGVPHSPTPFDREESNSARALRIHLNGAAAEASAWFDTIMITRPSGDDQGTLFRETFDAGAVYTPSPGSIAALEPPDVFGTPALCTSVTVLEASPNTLEFSAVEGTSNPASQSIYLADNGIIPLLWTAEENISWASLDHAEGTTPAEIRVSVDTAGMGTGVYTGQITVTSDTAQLGSTHWVNASLTIHPEEFVDEPCPEGRAGEFPGEYWENISDYTFAATDTMKLAFSIIPTTAPEHSSVALDEIGGGTRYALYFFNGTVYDQDHGNNFADDVPLASYNESQWNVVRAEYNFSTQQYMLHVNGIVWGPFPIISHGGPDSVHALRIHSTIWVDTLSVERIGDATAIYRNNFDGGSIPGDYPLPLACSSLEVLQVSPLLLQFSAVEAGGNPNPQSVLIEDDGTDSQGWTASESINWVDLSNTEGSTPAALDVSVDVSGLSAGEYSGPIMIFASDGQGSPQPVSVHLLVEPSNEIPATDIILSTSSGYGNNLLDWNPTNNPDVVAYRVWRAIGESGTFVPVTTTVDTAYLDIDSALVPDTTYCYQVSAMLLDDTVVRQSDVDCAVLGQLEIWVPDVWAAPGQTRVVPVNIRKATGLRISDGDIWMTFDGSVIELTNVSATPLTDAYTWTYSITSTTTYSQVHVSTFKSTPPTLFGEGTLFWLTFRAIGAEADESPLDLEEFVEGVGGSTIYTPDDPLNPVPLQLQAGVFHVATGCVLGDLNRDGVVQATDAHLALQIADEEFEPTVEQLVSGDVNGTGAVDAADATMILHYAVHGTWPSVESVSDMRPSSADETDGDVVSLSLTDVIGAPGHIVQTTLQAENLFDWAGGEFIIAYDVTVVESITNVQVGDFASGLALEYHDDGVGLLCIALASDVPVSGGGALAQVSFRIASNDVSLGRTTLALLDAALNDITGRDYAASALQTTILRHSAELRVDLNVYLPLVLK